MFHAALDELALEEFLVESEEGTFLCLLNADLHHVRVIGDKQPIYQFMDRLYVEILTNPVGVTIKEIMDKHSFKSIFCLRMALAADESKTKSILLGLFKDKEAVLDANELRAYINHKTWIEDGGSGPAPDDFKGCDTALLAEMIAERTKDLASDPDPLLTLSRMWGESFEAQKQYPGSNIVALLVDSVILDTKKEKKDAGQRDQLKHSLKGLLNIGKAYFQFDVADQKRKILDQKFQEIKVLLKTQENLDQQGLPLTPHQRTVMMDIMQAVCLGVTRDIGALHNAINGCIMTATPSWGVREPKPLDWFLKDDMTSTMSWKYWLSGSTGDFNEVSQKFLWDVSVILDAFVSFDSEPVDRLPEDEQQLILECGQFLRAAREQRGHPSPIFPNAAPATLGQDLDVAIRSDQLTHDHVAQILSAFASGAQSLAAAEDWQPRCLHPLAAMRHSFWAAGYLSKSSDSMDDAANASIKCENLRELTPAIQRAAVPHAFPLPFLRSRLGDQILEYRLKGWDRERAQRIVAKAVVAGNPVTDPDQWILDHEALARLPDYIRFGAVDNMPSLFRLGQLASCDQRSTMADDQGVTKLSAGDLEKFHHRLLADVENGLIDERVVKILKESDRSDGPDWFFMRVRDLIAIQVEKIGGQPDEYLVAIEEFIRGVRDGVNQMPSSANEKKQKIQDICGLLCHDALPAQSPLRGLLGHMMDRDHELTHHELFVAALPAKTEAETRRRVRRHGV